MAIVAIILMLLLTVGIHEGAHALVASLFGIKIKKISIGFGKPLVSWQGKKGCEWVFARWPLGGYVEMLNTRVDKVAEKDHPVCFDKKPVWMRICVLLAGSLANLVFAFLLLMVVFLAGLPAQKALVTITPDSMAAKAGLQSGDTILAIENKAVPSLREMNMWLVTATGKEKAAVQVQTSQGEKKTLYLDLRIEKNQRGKALMNWGIVPAENAPLFYLKAHSLLEACLMSFQFIYETCAFMLTVLGMLITKVLPISLLIGPLGMFSLTITSFFQGFIAFIFFTAAFSVAIGLANLLPIPALDGGSIVYALIEKIRGKPVSVAMEILLHRFALIAAGLLLVQLLVNDLTV